METMSENGEKPKINQSQKATTESKMANNNENASESEMTNKNEEATGSESERESTLSKHENKQ